MREKYNGPISKHKMTKDVLRAYECLCSGRARAKRLGLEHKVDTHEFISWYLKEQIKHNFKIPSVSRLDHSKGYNWDNFILEERDDNAKEAAIRNKDKHHIKSNCIRTDILDIRDGTLLMTCSSISAAAKATGVDFSLVQNYISGSNKKPKKHGYTYRRSQ